MPWGGASPDIVTRQAMAADGKGQRNPDAFLVEPERLQRGLVIIPVAPEVVRTGKSPDSGLGSSGICFFIGVSAVTVSRPVACPAAGNHDISKVGAANIAGGNEAVAVGTGDIARHGSSADGIIKIERGFLIDIDGAASPPAFRRIETAEADALAMNVDCVAIHHRCDTRNLGASCDGCVRLAAKGPVGAETKGQDKKNNRKGREQTAKAPLRPLLSWRLRAGPLAPAVVRIEPDDVSIQKEALCLTIFRIKAFAHSLNQPERWLRKSKNKRFVIPRSVSACSNSRNSSYGP